MLTVLISFLFSTVVTNAQVQSSQNSKTWAENFSLITNHVECALSNVEFNTIARFQATDFDVNPEALKNELCVLLKSGTSYQVILLHDNLQAVFKALEPGYPIIKRLHRAFILRALGAYDEDQIGNVGFPLNTTSLQFIAEQFNNFNSIEDQEELASVSYFIRHVINAATENRFNIADVINIEDYSEALINFCSGVNILENETFINFCTNNGLATVLDPNEVITINPISVDQDGLFETELNINPLLSSASVVTEANQSTIDYPVFLDLNLSLSNDDPESDTPQQVIADGF